MHRLFKQPDISEATLNSLKMINQHQVDGGCQFAAIEAVKVLLDEKYAARYIDPKVDFSKHRDPIEAHLKDMQTALCKNAQQLMDEVKQLEPSECLIIDAETEIDHAYVIYKSINNNYWLIDADRGVFKKVDIDKSSDFVQCIQPWKEEKEYNFLDYLAFKSLTTLESEELLKQADIPLDKLETDFDIYKFSKNELDALNKFTLPVFIPSTSIPKKTGCLYNTRH